MPRHRPRTRWVAAAATLTAALALVVGGVLVAGPAQAATSVTDDFEGNPFARWAVEFTRGSSHAHMGNHGPPARSGENIAWMDAPGSAIARIYRSVSLDRPGSGTVLCHGQVHLRKFAGFDGGREALPDPRIALRVRAGGPSGAVISLKIVTASDVNAWTLAYFNSFSYQAGPLTVEIAASYGEMVFVDDVSVWCNPDID